MCMCLCVCVCVCVRVCVCRHVSACVGVCGRVWACVGGWVGGPGGGGVGLGYGNSVCASPDVVEGGAQRGAGSLGKAFLASNPWKRERWAPGCEENSNTEVMRR